jgi:hypothetical protein
MSKYNKFLPFFILLTMASLFYRLPLFFGYSQVHSDGLVFSLPLQHLLVDFFTNNGNLLWSNLISGGHPIFAEAQGGFANPINMIVGLLMDGRYGYNFLHWLSMVLGGVGVYGLCRYQNISRCASLFGALAVVFSSLWLHEHRNGTVSSAASLIPWVIWGMLNWYDNFDLKSACLFGIAVSFMVLAGYPHILHGTILYLFIYIIFTFFFTSERKKWGQHIVKRFSTGFLAVLICICITAVQWIPLLELVSQSARRDGVQLGWIGMIPPVSFLRGALYTAVEPGGEIFPVVGSLFVLLIGSTFVFFRLSSKIVCHIAATLSLVVLGAGVYSPIFMFIYENGFLPGLDSFRVMYIYMIVAVVGISIISALCLDKIVETLLCYFNSSHPDDKPISLIRKLLLIIWAFCWLAILYKYHVPQVSSFQYILIGIGIFILIISINFSLHQIVPYIAIFLLISEIFFLRFGTFGFASSDAFSTPSTVTHLESISPIKDYKVMSLVPRVLHSSSSGSEENKILTDGARDQLASLNLTVNLLYDIPSMDMTHGLPTYRRALAQETLRSEIKGTSITDPGLRLIDYLSVRFVIARVIDPRTQFQLSYSDERTNISVYENSKSKPKFQVFDDVIFVKTPSESLQVLSQLTSSKLIVEVNDLSSVVVDNRLSTDSFNYELMKDSQAEYQFRLTAPSDVWFFIADANYPGWEAFLDGEEVDLYSAQVLGKAVYIKEGSEELIIRYRPFSFIAGLTITLCSIFLLLLLLFLLRVKNIFFKN